MLKTSAMLIATLGGIVFLMLLFELIEACTENKFLIK